MPRAIRLVAMVAGFLLLIGSAFGDWNVGDPYKMVHPQLPNTNGWDVSPHDQGGAFTELADDWICSQTGPVSDIHLWYSWNNDVAHTFDVEVNICTNFNAGGFNQPGDSVWSGLFSSGQFSTRIYATGNQGWYVPNTNLTLGWLPNNHTNAWQLNIENIQSPFIQQQGNTYWLVVELTGPNSTTIGWKTSIDTNGASAVWLDTSSAVYVWRKLADQSNHQMDLAFIITPEPSTFLLVALGAVALIALRGRHARR